MSNVSDKKTISSLFERSIEIEQRVRDIYTEFSKRFSQIPDVSAFWNDLAHDESIHMDALRTMSNSLSEEQLASSADPQIWEYVRRNQYLLETDVTEEIKNLDDAYELAHEIEFSEVNAIFKFLANEFISNEDRKNFVTSEIHQHQNKLMDFKKNFGDREWRKTIPIP